MSSTVANVITQVGALPTEIVALTTLFILLFFIILSQGKKPFISTIVSFYPAILLYIYFPYSEFIPGGEQPISSYAGKILLFAVFFAIAYIASKYFIRKKINATGGKKGFQSALLGLSLTALISAVLGVIIPISDVYELSPVTQSVLNEDTLVWWLLAPIVTLLFSKK